MLAQNIFDRRWRVSGLKTLIKKSVRGLLLWWSLQLCGQFVVDHNADMSQWCHCCHFL